MFYLDLYPPYVVEYPIYPPVIQEYVVVQPAYPTVERRQIIIQPDGTRIEIDSTTLRRYPYNGCCNP